MSHWQTLVDCATLHEHLEDSDWRVVDCRFRLDDPGAGRRAWKESHIPGALHADIEKDLSSPPSSGSGRHPLPDRDDLVELFNALGISNDSQVVAYDDNGGAFAARMWWLLRWMGHPWVAVLDGGWPAWAEKDLPVSNRPPRVAEGSFVAHEPLVETVTAPDIERGGHTLVDARAPERYRGELEPIDAVAGHIPGAVNRPFAGNIDSEGLFLPAEALRRRFSFEAEGPVVHYCGSGVTACHNVLAMEIAGLAGARLYPGSWSEWITEPGRPVARGND